MAYGLIHLIQEIRFMLSFKKLSDSDLQVLNDKFPYYRNLNSAHQEDFRKRVLYFLYHKSFIPRGGLPSVTREMKILVAATAVMVSFGFENVHLRHFSKILIYPDDYFSTINKQYHQGEVNPRLGIIVLSWQNFIKGLTGDHDGVNLGIHEMAHALNLENRIHYNRESNFFNPQKWKRFIVEAKRELEKMNNGESDFFRESAAINSHEFFAVTLEAFFEKPLEFRSYNEGLYKALVFLLQQDPIVLTSKRDLA